MLSVTFFYLAYQGTVWEFGMLGGVTFKHACINILFMHACINNTHKSIDARVFSVFLFRYHLIYAKLSTYLVIERCDNTTNTIMLLSSNRNQLTQ